MKIFIASSKENINLMREIEVWLEENNHESIPWDKPGLFPPGEQTFISLINISKQVDGAIIIFGEDDEVWYRGDSAKQPRDNVLIEYGLFVGALGPQKAIICRNNYPKNPTDLQGITVIELNNASQARGRLELKIWANRLNTNPIDPMYLKLSSRIYELEHANSLLEHQILFEKEKSIDLGNLLQKENIVDISNVDLTNNEYWKLLFEYKYFENAAKLLSSNIKIPIDLCSMLNEYGANKVAEKISWQSDGYNSQKNIILTRKVLRVFRTYYNELFSPFIKRLSPDIQSKFKEFALSTLAEKSLY